MENSILLTSSLTLNKLIKKNCPVVEIIFMEKNTIFLMLEDSTYYLIDLINESCKLEGSLQIFRYRDI